ncbi:NAC domain-containing protein [Melia azedarach]|uniref:NAC domain-containing protein n=1 Tax=Melia azedarach TaxID=155640 RepID=A0ACC1X210_MELAZ|nr:NAC domain-containing protein [Melia azedarach]
MVEEYPPGFRFYPTEEELISFYLRNKLEGRRQDLNRLMDRIIPVVNIYDYNPWDLPQFSEYLCHRDPEQWFFFIPRHENEARGGRPNRLTTAGYWKATGSPGFVYSSNRVVGEKRTMVFYTGRAPSGTKTEWKMNEYKAIEGEASITTIGAPMVRPEFSLCRVYKKSKCFRSFDRRPSPGPWAQRVRHQVSTSFDHNPTVQMAAVERTSSPESSSSGDYHGNQPPQTVESSSNMAMTSNGEAWWDWEQLNFYCELRKC